MSDRSHPILMKRDVLSALATLSSELRHDVFRLLVRNEPDGSDIATVSRDLKIGVDAARLALASLERATLARRIVEDKSELYRANLDVYGSMMSFLRQPIEPPLARGVALETEASDLRGKP